MTLDKIFKSFSNKVRGLKPALLMLFVQVGFAMTNILYKLALNDGMDLKVLVAYRYIFAFAFITPIAYFVERNNRPKLSWIILSQGFLCGLFGGALTQNLYLVSMNIMSATYASAMSNFVPPCTFILAVIFRYEKLGIRTIVGQVKIWGTLIGLSGSMLLTFYKGIQIPIPSTQTFHIHKVHKDAEGLKELFGVLVALGSCLSYASWLMVQAKMGERYPCHYSSASLMCGFSAVLCFIYSMSDDKDLSQWKLGWNVRLLAVMFSGIVASGLSITLMAWCVQLKGPLFVSIFNPLMVVLVALISSVILEEKLHLGTVLGTVLIIIGLYAILWGKGKEMKRLAQLVPNDSVKEEPYETDDIVVRSESHGSGRSIICADFPYSYAINLEPESEITMVRSSSLNNTGQHLNNEEMKETIEENLKKTTTDN